MDYIYSATRNLFFPLLLKEQYEKAGDWPDDGVTIDEAVFLEFKANPRGEKMRIAGNDGLPVWVDIPPLSKEQQVAQEEQKRQSLRTKADTEIAWRQDAVDAGIATEEETSALAEWKKYRVLLMRVDTSKAPDTDWPLIPS